jgi:hypothetical protein
MFYIAVCFSLWLYCCVAVSCHCVVVCCRSFAPNDGSISSDATILFLLMTVEVLVVTIHGYVDFVVVSSFAVYS